MCVRGGGGAQGWQAAPSLALFGCSVSGGYNGNGRQNQLPGQVCLEISDIADSGETFTCQLGKTVQREQGGAFHYLAHFLALVFRALFPPCSHSICCICFSLPLSLSLSFPLSLAQPLIPPDGADGATVYWAPHSETVVMKVEKTQKKKT